MDEQDKKQFAAIMYGVADNFGGQISKDGLRLRFEALSNLDIDEVSRVATWLINNRTATFPAIPTVKEFRDALENLDGPKPSPRSRAEIQADKVLAKLKYHGRAGKADFEDPITQELMTTRWPYRAWASLVLEKELVWWRKEFIQAYQAYSEQSQIEALPQAETRKIAAPVLKLVGGIRKRM